MRINSQETNYNTGGVYHSRWLRYREPRKGLNIFLHLLCNNYVSLIYKHFFYLIKRFSTYINKINLIIHKLLKCVGYCTCYNLITIKHCRIHSWKCKCSKSRNCKSQEPQVFHICLQLHKLSIVFFLLF